MNETLACCNKEDRDALWMEVEGSITVFMTRFPDSRVMLSLDIWENGQAMYQQPYVTQSRLFLDRTDQAESDAAWNDPDNPFRDEPEKEATL